MFLLAVLGGVVLALALAGLYDFRVRRRGGRVPAIRSNAARNRIPACQQGVWAQPNIDRDPRR
jgi:hypothetical protein